MLFGRRKRQLEAENDALRGELASFREPAVDIPTIHNESISIPITDSASFAEIFGSGITYAGPVVNSESAMRCSAVYACVRLISGAVSCSPVKTYRRDGDLRTPANNHPLARTLRLRPNRFMTAATFWKAFMNDKLLAGNAYANIVRDANGNPVALIPVRALGVSVYYAWELGLDARLGVERNRLFYGVHFPDGAYRLYDQDDMLHVPNVGWTGKVGISSIQAMAQSVGLALGAEESDARFLSNGMQAEYAITYSNQLNDQAAKKLREYLEERHGGSSNHHKPLVLTEGGDVKQLSMTAADAQLLETRKFSVIDICRFFGVNPVMVGESEKTSSWGAGVEQMGRWFNTLTLNEHFTAIEQELEAKLFRGDGCFAEFDESELTRGDTKTRAEFYNVMRGSLTQPGIMLINEIRAAEGLEPVPGGDVLFIPQPTANPAPAQETP